MGYTTDFNGILQLSKPATEEQMEYLNRFSNTRRMKRMPDILHKKHMGKYGLDGNYGIDGEYFCMDDGNYGQNEDASIIDYNKQPSTQPSLWCQWILSDAETLQWDGSEKFYCYVPWLQYLIDNFFNYLGIKLNGEITWQGEDNDDMGKIIVTDNVIEVLKGVY